MPTDVKLCAEGRYLPWGKKAADKLQEMQDWIDNGGGNPNEVQTITGTLEGPFGILSKTISDGLYSGDCSALMHADAKSIGFGEFDLILKSNSDGIEADYVSMTANVCAAVQVTWAEILDFGVSFAYFCSASVSEETLTITDISEYASLIRTTVTVIWHPLPESE